MKDNVKLDLLVEELKNLTLHQTSCLEKADISEYIEIGNRREVLINKLAKESINEDVKIYLGLHFSEDFKLIKSLEDQHIQILNSLMVDIKDQLKQMSVSKNALYSYLGKSDQSPQETYFLDKQS